MTTTGTTPIPQASISFAVRNANYSDLMVDAALRLEFEQAVINATVRKLAGISADDVQIVLSSGSIRVELIISPSSPGLVGGCV